MIYLIAHSTINVYVHFFEFHMSAFILIAISIQKSTFIFLKHTNIKKVICSSFNKHNSKLCQQMFNKRLISLKTDFKWPCTYAYVRISILFDKKNCIG